MHATESVLRSRSGRLRGTLLAAALLLGSGAAVAGPFEDGLAAYQRQDYAVAYDAWKPLAEAGDASAQNNLGALYSQGAGVARDYPAARDWWRRAAEQARA